MIERFNDVINMEEPGLIIRPYSSDLQQLPIELQESLFDLRCDDVVEASFPKQDYNILWCNVAKGYPAVWARVRMMICVLQRRTSWRRVSQPLLDFSQRRRIGWK